MQKQVLVIGGTYFAGRVFTILASRTGDYALTLANRGRYSMSRYPDVSEYRCDRHDAAALQALPARDWDAVVDFCAYEPGEIRTVLENLKGSVRRYLFISTADVCERGDTPADESRPVISAAAPGPVGDYLFKKAALEAELRAVCAERGVSFTVLRPAFLYGPFNYAPRESFYVQSIAEGTPIPVPTDADGKWQFVFVSDMARAIMKCIDSAAAADQVYHLAAPEQIDYPAFMAMLRKVADRPFAERPVTAAQVQAEGLPLPFPLSAGESELFSGEKICRELDFTYTPFEEGLGKAYAAFLPVFEQK